MCPFYQEEKPKPYKIYKCLSSTLKDAFSSCDTFCGRLSTSSGRKEEAEIEFDEEEEVFVSTVTIAYVKSKNKRRAGNRIEKVSCIFTPVLRTLYLKENTEDGETESFFDAGSNLSCFSDPASIEAFVSAQASFSPSSSLNSHNYHYTAQRHPSISENFHLCEGWPFGLYRKTMLCPPLLKSPSGSWSWSKNVGNFSVR